MLSKNYIRFCYVVFALILASNYVLGQNSWFNDSLEFADSTTIKSSVQWLNINKIDNFDPTELSLNHKHRKDIKLQLNYHPSQVMPKNPLDIDYRGSSYYVPRMVKDELNLMMNRPKNNSFVPILGAAFIAAQLASKYLIIKKKTEITAENILNTIDSKRILEDLWMNSPKTASQLYNNPDIRKKYTWDRLNEDISKLINNKLIKQKNIEDSEKQYFPAVTENQFNELLQTIKKATK